MNRIIAIDPGVRGALVTGFPDRSEVKAHKFQYDEIMGLGILEWFSVFDTQYDYDVWMEKPVKYRGRNVPGSTAMVYGQSCGALEATVRLLGPQSFSFIEPHKWQRGLGLGQAGRRSQVQWKRYLKDAAVERFPDHKVTLANADAFLIWEWANTKEKNN